MTLFNKPFLLILPLLAGLFFAPPLMHATAHPGAILAADAPAVVLRENVTLAPASSPVASVTAIPTPDLSGNPAVPPDLNGAVQELPALVAAAKASQWDVVAGMLLGLIVLLVERYLLTSMTIKSTTLQWIMVGISVAGSLALHLVQHAGWLAALLASVPVLISAIFSYHVLDEHLPEPKTA